MWATRCTTRATRPGRRAYTQIVEVTFEVGGKKYAMAEAQATILAENLRVLAKSQLVPASESAAVLAKDSDWRPEAQELADTIESALVAGNSTTLHLEEGGAADATYCVLRLMVGADTEQAAPACATRSARRSSRAPAHGCWAPPSRFGISRARSSSSC